MAFFITATSMLPGLGGMELSKLPNLIEHYKKHQQLNPGISLVAFLEMHYADATHHKQDHQEHHKLPFTDHQSTVATAFVYFVADRNYSFTAELFTIGSTHQSVYQSIIAEDITIHVWQPPRISC